MSKLHPSLLKQLPLFASLSFDELQEVLSQATPKRRDNGCEVFAEGDQADKFYLLLDGHIRVSRINENGEHVILLHIQPGHLFGIGKALGRTNYPATATAAGEVFYLEWPSTVWPHFVQAYPVFGQAAFGSVGNRLQEMNTRIMELVTQHVEQRVALAVLRMAEQSGRRDRDGVTIDFPVTRQNVADMTGTTLFTVSRLLSAWSKEAIIASGRSRIKVLRPDRLESLAKASP